MSSEKADVETSFRGFGIPDEFNEKFEKMIPRLEEVFAGERPDDAVIFMCRFIISKAYRSYDAANADACVRLASSLIQKVNTFNFKAALKKEQKQH